MDLVLFGATGFTGRLVAEHLASALASVAGFRWALAGRDLNRLAGVHTALRLSPAVDMILADADNPASLAALVARSRTVVTTVGPYQAHGSGLVEACAAAGCDYLDLCGEPLWMRRMIEAHEGRARTTGARILFSCGFDSIPFELGVLFLQLAAERAFGRPLPHVKARVRRLRGGLSGGTAASLRGAYAEIAADPAAARLMADPFALTPGFGGAPQPGASEVAFDPDLHAWVAPFLMAPINVRNVHRSNRLMGGRYGGDFTYDEMIVGGEGPAGEARARALAGMEQAVQGGAGPAPGDGPPAEDRAAGNYDILFLGQDAGRRLAASVSAEEDPGYGSTARMIAETALCLLGSPETPGGVWTPGAALGAALIERLQARAGLTFRLEP